jgi:predicted dehydrogenase
VLSFGALLRRRWSRDVTTYRIAEETGGHGGSDPRLVDAFIEAVRGNRPLESTLEHGLWSTAIGDAAERAWREGRTVAISEVLGEGTV